MKKRIAAIETITRAEAEGELGDLSRMGLEERSILDLTLVVAYFNLVNRIASGLGVELE